MNDVLAFAVEAQRQEADVPTAPTESAEVTSATSSVQLATELLGGRRVLHRQVATEEDAHELVLHGIPAEAMAKLFAGVSLPSNVLLATLGVSERSFARRKAAPKTRCP